MSVTLYVTNHFWHHYRFIYDGYIFGTYKREYRKGKAACDILLLQAD